MEKTQEKIWTYDDYYQLDDDKRYEVIEGELVEMSAAPRSIHQIILSNLSYELIHYTRHKKIGRVLVSPLDVVFSATNSFQPDLVFISNEDQQIIDEKKINGTPSLVIEILSPSNPDHDRVRKFKIYEKFKVKEYWIIDPIGESIEIFCLEKDKLLSCCLVRDEQKLQSKTFADLSISYNDLLI